MKNSIYLLNLQKWVPHHAQFKLILFLSSVKQLPLFNSSSEQIKLECYIKYLWKDSVFEKIQKKSLLLSTTFWVSVGPVWNSRQAQKL